MFNRVTTPTSAKRVRIKDLEMGQLFIWESSTRNSRVGIRSEHSGLKIGITLDEGTYLTEEVEVYPIQSQTQITLVAA